VYGFNARDEIKVLTKPRSVKVASYRFSINAFLDVVIFWDELFGFHSIKRENFFMAYLCVNNMTLLPVESDGGGFPGRLESEANIPNTYLFLSSVPTSTPKPRTLRGLVKMENWPSLAFSLEYFTSNFSVE
jgi:hypothetical protein